MSTFQEAINRMMASTVVAVSQSLTMTTIRRCDMIFVMDKGRIVESSTHDELMKMIVKKTSLTVIAGFYPNLGRRSRVTTRAGAGESSAIEASIDH